MTATEPDLHHRRRLPPIENLRLELRGRGARRRRARATADRALRLRAAQVAGRGAPAWTSTRTRSTRCSAGWRPRVSSTASGVRKTTVQKRFYRLSAHGRVVLDRLLEQWSNLDALAPPHHHGGPDMTLIDRYLRAVRDHLPRGRGRRHHQRALGQPALAGSRTRRPVAADRSARTRKSRSCAPSATRWPLPRATAATSDP